METTKSSNPLIAPDYFLHHLNSPVCYPNLSLLPLANQPFLSLLSNLFGFHLASAMMMMIPPAPTTLPAIVDLHSCLLLGDQMNTNTQDSSTFQTRHRTSTSTHQHPMPSSLIINIPSRTECVLSVQNNS